MPCEWLGREDVGARLPDSHLAGIIVKSRVGDCGSQKLALPSEHNLLAIRILYTSAAILSIRNTQATIRLPLRTLCATSSHRQRLVQRYTAASQVALNCCLLDNEQTSSQTTQCPHATSPPPATAHSASSLCRSYRSHGPHFPSSYCIAYGGGCGRQDPRYGRCRHLPPQ